MLLLAVALGIDRQPDAPKKSPEAVTVATVRQHQYSDQIWLLPRDIMIAAVEKAARRIFLPSIGKKDDDVTFSPRWPLPHGSAANPGDHCLRQIAPRTEANGADWRVP